MTMRWQYSTLLLLGLAAACGGNDTNPVTNSCGDGTVGGSEQCDDGNTTSGDGCSATCQTEIAHHCGDGTVDVGTEQCDDGNTQSGDGCSATCQTETVMTCGNGVIDGAEACDDHNTAAGDGCSATCTVETGYTCTGTPSVCMMIPTANGSCTAPFVVTLTNTAGTLAGSGMGDNTMGTSQVAAAPCDTFSSEGAGNDQIWQFTLTDTRDVTITLGDTTTFDGLIRLLSTPCMLSTEVPEHNGADGCSDAGITGDPEVLRYSKMPAGTYYLVVDGYNAAQLGTYNFTISAAPTTCGNGVVDPGEVCDDGNVMTGDGCNARCDAEPGYVCVNTTNPSVCSLSCGNGTLDPGEECEDGGTVNGDRCSSTCTLEFDVMEVEPNNTTAQTITATNHIIRGALPAGDVDLYTFTLTAPATVELETYNSMDPSTTYSGVGTNTTFDCKSLDSEIRIFNAAGDVTMNATATAFDDDDGTGLCSYVGTHDGTDGTGADPTEGTLAAGTYTIKVTMHSATASSTRYLLDMKITSATMTPVPPLPGDLALNELMAAGTTADTNCDGVTTGTNDEFVELVNVSSKTLDLTGVTIADATQIRYTFAPAATGSMTLAPGKAVVVWSGGAPACPGVTDWFALTGTGTDILSLDDGGDTITVKNAAMVQLLSVTYPAATANVSANLSPDVTGTTYALHTAVSGAVGAFSPGKRANGTAF